MRARYYSPTLQRFLTPDPLMYGGGDVNFFNYSHKDPVNFSDPMGLMGGTVGAGAGPGPTGPGSGPTRSFGGKTVGTLADYVAGNDSITD